MASKKISKRRRYNFLIDEDVYQEFSQLCEELGLIRSRNIEHYMKDFLNKNKEHHK